MAIRRINPVLGTDECGKPEIFTIPHDALFYDTPHASCAGEVMVLARGVQHLISKAEKHDDITERLIFRHKDRVAFRKNIKKAVKWQK